MQYEFSVKRCGIGVQCKRSGIGEQCSWGEGQRSNQLKLWRWPPPSPNRYWFPPKSKQCKCSSKKAFVVWFVWFFGNCECAIWEGYSIQFLIHCELGWLVYLGIPKKLTLCIFDKQCRCLCGLVWLTWFLLGLWCWVWSADILCDLKKEIFGPAKTEEGEVGKMWEKLSKW